MHARTEQSRDAGEIERLLDAAFGGPAESGLVAALRDHEVPLISLVAVDNGQVVGHILFSPVALDDHPDLRLMALAPMAVLPDRQRQGIGSLLVRSGLERCRESGIGAVIVLGHPEYYPRFGFRPASRFGINCAYAVPDEAFMALELDAGYLAEAAGTIRYHECFDAA